MVKRLVFAALFWAASTLAAPAEAPDIRSVIGWQMEALAANDAEKAFSYASPAIQALFGTPGNFVRMVETGYPMVWRPGSVAYGKMTYRDGKVIQPVFITDQAGRQFIADYEMVGGPHGWLINGVTVRAAEQPSV